MRLVWLFCGIQMSYKHVLFLSENVEYNTHLFLTLCDINMRQICVVIITHVCLCMNLMGLWSMRYTCVPLYGIYKIHILVLFCVLTITCYFFLFSVGLWSVVHTCVSVCGI